MEFYNRKTEGLFQGKHLKKGSDIHKDSCFKAANSDQHQVQCKLGHSIQGPQMFPTTSLTLTKLISNNFHFGKYSGEFSSLSIKLLNK